MKAMVQIEYGPPDVLQLKELDKPQPKHNEILIRIHATSVAYGDTMARRFNTVTSREFNMPLLFLFLARIEFGFKRPKKTILGTELAGVVEAVGRDVTRFKPGDQVFGYRSASFGANAEYLCMPEKGTLAPKPTNLAFDQAATIPYGSLVAYNLFKRVTIRPGSTVLINGASGSLGAYGLQLAKHAGAHVTGVCGTLRMDLVKSLGADEVIDYTKQDFTQMDEQYDLIFDVLGKSSFARCKGSLKPKGRYLRASWKTRHLLQMLWTKLFSSKKVVCGLAVESAKDLEQIKDLVEAGAVKPFVDKRFALEDLAEAHRYAESGQKTGTIAIIVTPDG